MRRALWLGLVLAVTACSRAATVTAPAAAPSAAPPADTASSPIPLHIVTQADGSRYVTIVQRVTTPHGPSRIVYELRALGSVSDVAGNDSSGTFEQPQVTFHDRSGTTLIADAPKATVTERDKSVVMTGGVHARSQDGETLACDRLRYDGRTERLHGEGHVLLSSANGVTIPGDVFDGNVKLDDVRVRTLK